MAAREHVGAVAPFRLDCSAPEHAGGAALVRRAAPPERGKRARWELQCRVLRQQLEFATEQTQQVCEEEDDYAPASCYLCHAPHCVVGVECTRGHVMCASCHHSWQMQGGRKAKRNTCSYCRGRVRVNRYKA